jgi:hypothetical protein
MHALCRSGMVSLTSISFSPHDHGRRNQGQHGHCHCVSLKLRCMSNLISEIHFPHHLEGLESNLAMNCIKAPRGMGGFVVDGG